MLSFLLMSLCVLAKVFVPTSKNTYEIKASLCEGSINSICDSLGYNTSMFYIYFTPKRKSDIVAVCYKIFTEDIICVITLDNVAVLTSQDVDQFLKDFNFKNIFSPWEREDYLNKGIKKKTLSYSFLSSVLDLKNDTIQGCCFVSEKFGYKLYFKDKFLCRWESLDGLNRTAKQWKESNPDYYELCYNKALAYWNNDSLRAIKDVNMQARSSDLYPDNILKFVDYFKDDGFTNYKMLLVTFHISATTLRDFKDNTYGDYNFLGIVVNSKRELYEYRYKIFNFYFTKSGVLFKILCKP